MSGKGHVVADRAEYSQDDLSRLAEDHLPDIVDTIDFRVVELEHTNDVVGLCKTALV
jgi:hypothetical protein